jgi:hypothetical protein
MVWERGLSAGSPAGQTGWGALVRKRAIARCASLDILGACREKAFLRVNSASSVSSAV